MQDQQANVFVLNIVDFLLGDMNGDGLVNLADVPAFIQALVDRAAYNLAYPLVDADETGNIDGSGQHPSRARTDDTFTRSCSSAGPCDSKATACVEYGPHVTGVSRIRSWTGVMLLVS